MDNCVNRESYGAVVDLFCGVGGMSLGFEQAGFNIAAAVDADRIHAAMHEANFPGCKTLNLDLTIVSGGDLIRASGLESTPISVVVGGPPCQGFSLIGKRDVEDPRNSLLQDFARLVCELKPRYFVMENVAGLLIGHAAESLSQMIKAVRKDQYEVVEPVRVLNARDFGVPQNRERVFVLGYRKGEQPPKYPKPDPSRTMVTVWDAIGDLDVLDDCDELSRSDVYFGELGPPSDYSNHLRKLPPNAERRHNGLSGCRRVKHKEEIVERFKSTLPGHTEPKSRLYRLDPNDVSRTLRAGTDGSRGSYTAPRPIHPYRNRCICAREAARLHSFPDWFQVHPTKWHGLREIGNAAPPGLAQAVAREIASCVVGTPNRGDGCGG